MENASKALIMVAGVLIAVMIMSLGVYLFLSFGADVADINKQIEIDRLNQFNTQFTSYVGKQGLTIYDVITVANLAKENNSYYELTSPNDANYYITVNLRKSGSTQNNLEKKTDSQLNQIIIQENLNQTEEDGESVGYLPEYKCQTHINSFTGRVDVITFF